MSKKGIGYLMFFVVLVLVFFLVVRKWVSPVSANSGLPVDVISVVRPFSFLNQDGQRVTEKDVAGKVYVAEYFFTHCPGICPTMNNNMRGVYDKFKNEKDFLILSHTCDPERDSVQQLKKYADSMQVNTAQWMFLTGRKDSLYWTARISYTLDDPADNLTNIDESFLHTQFWALVNKKGQVKRIYDGLKKSEIEDMERDIARMLKQ